LDNDFTIHNVRAVDYPQWNTDGLIFDKSITTPQYSARIGRFINRAKTLALELNYDHTKYSSLLDQHAAVTGTIGGSPVGGNQKLTHEDFWYNLHNGANHIMINIVQRIPFGGTSAYTKNLFFLCKEGAGIMLPHADNMILGKENEVGEKKWGNLVGTKKGWWQLNGVTAGVEAGLRFAIHAPFYLELTDKIAYAKLYNVPVYQGTAAQSLWMNEIILSLGVTVNGDK